MFSPRIFLGLSLLALTTGCYATVGHAPTHHADSEIMPDVRGWSLAAFQHRFSGYGVEYREANCGVPADHLCGSVPEQGARLYPYATLIAYVQVHQGNVDRPAQDPGRYRPPSEDWERQQRERAERERAERERAERERQEREWAERERAERERQRERADREKKDREDKERADREKKDREDKERADREKKGREVRDRETERVKR
jgi:hypothetical protein